MARTEAQKAASKRNFVMFRLKGIYATLLQLQRMREHDDRMKNILLDASAHITIAMERMRGRDIWAG